MKSAQANNTRKATDSYDNLMA